MNFTGVKRGWSTAKSVGGRFLGQCLGALGFSSFMEYRFAPVSTPI